MLCAAQTLFDACCVTRLLLLSSTSSDNSTFLLTGKQCITFAEEHPASFFVVSIHEGSLLNNFPYSL